MQQKRHPRWEMRDSIGVPIKAFGTHLIPLTRIARIDWPGGNVIWQRPVAIEIQREDRRERLPITNMTRRVIVGLVLSGILFVIVVTFGERIYASRQRRKNHDRCPQ